MKDIGKAKIWELHDEGNWIVIPINGYVRRDGLLTMGAGLARALVDKYPELNIAEELGLGIGSQGLQVFVNPSLRVFAFPTKYHWQDDADISLIKESAQQMAIIATHLEVETVALPQVGCGNGKLKWEEVRKVLEPILDDRFYAFERTYTPSNKNWASGVNQKSKSKKKVAKPTTTISAKDFEELAGP